MNKYFTVEIFWGE